MHQKTSLPERPDADAAGPRLEGLKWLAILSMTVDHAGKTVAFEHLEPTHAAGRLALPLFMLIIGLRLAARPELATRYIRRLIPWALVAQPAYTWISGLMVGNILFCLTLGIALFWCIQQATEGGRDWAGPLAIVCLGLSPWVEFGLVGVCSVPALAFAARWRPRWAAALCGPLALLANGIPMQTLAPLLATPVALLGLRWAPRLPRLPGVVFYAYYPAHLYALYGAMVWQISRY